MWVIMLAVGKNTTVSRLRHTKCTSPQFQKMHYTFKLGRGIILSRLKNGVGYSAVEPGGWVGSLTGPHVWNKVYDTPFFKCTILQWSSSVGDLQGPVFDLVARHHAFEAAIFLAQFSHLLSQCRVLTLEECRPHCDLVLLETARVTRAFSRHVVLLPPLPVLIVLRVGVEEKNEEQSEGKLRTS